MLAFPAGGVGLASARSDGPDVVAVAGDIVEAHRGSSTVSPALTPA
jgi:hypothetical protein